MIRTTFGILCASIGRCATLPLAQKGRYVLIWRTPSCYSMMPGGAIRYEITSEGKASGFEFDIVIGSGSWRKMGEYDLASDATLRIVPAKSKGRVIADGFALIPAEKGE